MCLFLALREWVEVQHAALHLERQTLRVALGKGNNEVMEREEERLNPGGNERLYV